ncbi:hypothetical protein BHE74_00007464 [Ensete ventricosum]|nr:hypothetical protein BHE74_00007464 [Ensete ventricosum]
MAWLGKVTLGGFPDLAGAVSKLSESVKNIEKNFDSALGLDEKHDSGDEDNKGIFEPVMAFMGNKGEEGASKASGKAESFEHPPSAEESEKIPSAETTALSDKGIEDSTSKVDDTDSNNASIVVNEPGELNEISAVVGSSHSHDETETLLSGSKEEADSFPVFQHLVDADGGASDNSQPGDSQLQIAESVESNVDSVFHAPEGLQHASDSQGSHIKNETEAEQLVDKGSPKHSNVAISVQESLEKEASVAIPVGIMKHDHPIELSDNNVPKPIGNEQDQNEASESVSHDDDATPKSAKLSSEAIAVEAENDNAVSNNAPNSMNSFAEVEKVKQEMKMMEAALQGAARQAQYAKTCAKAVLNLHNLVFEILVLCS